MISSLLAPRHEGQGLLKLLKAFEMPVKGLLKAFYKLSYRAFYKLSYRAF